MEEINWSYLAGFFDGEGNIFLCTSARRYKDHYNLSAQPRVTISNSHLKGMQKIRDFLKENNIKCSWYKQKRGLNKHGIMRNIPCYQVIILAWASLEILVDNLISLCIIKKERLLLMKQAIDLHKTIPYGKTKEFIPQFKKIGYEISRRNATRRERKENNLIRQS